MDWLCPKRKISASLRVINQATKSKKEAFPSQQKHFQTRVNKKKFKDQHGKAGAYEDEIEEALPTMPIDDFNSSIEHVKFIFEIAVVDRASYEVPKPTPTI